MANVLIQHGTIVTAEGERQADLRITSGRVQDIRMGLSPSPGEDVIDAKGLLVLPGIVDGHTHFELDTGKMRTRDLFSSGTATAAAGGVTTFINFAPQEPCEPLVEAIQREKKKAEGASLIDFSLHLSFGTPGPDWRRDLDAAVAYGVSSAKVYTTYKDTIFYTRDWTIYQLLQETAKKGMLVQVHAENDDLLAGQTEALLSVGKKSFAYHAASRPEAAEVEAVSRLLAFSRLTGAPVYFVHISSPVSIDLVHEARAAGVPAYAEVCPHHISLTDQVYTGSQASRYVMTPPLRSLSSVKALIERTSSGMVDVVGSDHCGYALDQRGADLDFTQASPGIPGTETLWPVVYTTLVASGKMPLPKAVALVTRNPAAIFGLYPQKGTLAPGSDGDVVLYDPNPHGPLDEATLHSEAGYSPWHGTAIAGRVVRTLARGDTVYQDGQVSRDFGRGAFVKAKPFDQAAVDALLGKR